MKASTAHVDLSPADPAIGHDSGISYDITGGLTTMAMQNRILGRTGVSVSPLCLGTMMFGPWGNKDEADSIRVIHRAWTRA